MNLKNKVQSLFLKIKDRWWWQILLLPLWIFFFTAFLVPKIINLGKASNTLKFLSYSINLKIWTLLLGVVIYGIVYKIYKYIVTRGKLTIVSATYGIGQDFADITNKLNDYIQDNKLKVVLSNKIAGDPYPGRQKLGSIEYKLGNSSHTRRYVEGDVIELP